MVAIILMHMLVRQSIYVSTCATIHESPHACASLSTSLKRKMHMVSLHGLGDLCRQLQMLEKAAAAEVMGDGDHDMIF